MHAVSAKKQQPDPCWKRRVLLVDARPIMRAGLAQLINQQGDLEVCGEAGSAREAMQCVAASKPDVAVVGISLTGKSGLELIGDLQRLHPTLPVLVFSMRDELLYAERVLRAGARGYVMKRAGPATVLAAIRRVLMGQIYVSERTSSVIPADLLHAPSLKGVSPIGTLTKREFEVFKLMGKGLTMRDIARRLHLSAKTVDAHRQRLKEKLRLGSTPALILYAVRWMETRSRS